MKKFLACILTVMMLFTAVPAFAGSTLHVSIWYDEVPNDVVVVPNVNEVLCDLVNTEYTYVVDKGTDVTFQQALGAIEILDGSGNIIFSTASGISSKLVTVTYETAIRQDRSADVWKDTTSPMKDFSYIKPGAVIHFGTPGSYTVKLTAGFSSMEERIEVQKMTSGWRSIPQMGFQVGEQEAPAVQIPALYTSSKVLINGKEVGFEAYNINGAPVELQAYALLNEKGDPTNYVKLRDVAHLLSDTTAKFEVTWDAEAHLIGLEKDKAYTAVGGELVPGNGMDKSCVPYKDGITLDGEAVSVTAYNINGNNYFKLRDICKLFDIGVAWDGATNTISLDTSVGYTE